MFSECLADAKPYNLTYFITFTTVAMFRDHLYVTKYIKPYKMCYLGDFIRKSIIICMIANCYIFIIRGDNDNLIYKNAILYL